MKRLLNQLSMFLAPGDNRALERFWDAVKLGNINEPKREDDTYDYSPYHTWQVFYLWKYLWSCARVDNGLDIETRERTCHRKPHSPIREKTAGTDSAESNKREDLNQHMGYAHLRPKP